MRQIKAFWGLKRKDKVMICRVSDLLENGFDPEWLSNEFVRLNQEVWGDITDSRYLWTKEMIKSHFRICPHLIYCAFENGEMVASLTNMITSETDIRKNRTWFEKTGNGFLTTHRLDGEIGFGVDLSVSKMASKKVSDRIILSAIFIGLFGEGLRAVYLGCRIPSYHKNQELIVDEYVLGKRSSGKPLDPELYFYLKNGFETVEIIPEYMEDPESLNYGVLIRWNNPFCRLTKMFPFFKTIMKVIGRGLFLRVPKK